jgi:hypothetical protein
MIGMSGEVLLDPRRLDDIRVDLFREALKA